MHHFGNFFPYSEIKSIWSEKYDNVITNTKIPLKNGAIDILNKIKKSGLPIAIATSTANDKAMLKLKNTGIKDFFRIIITGDQVKESKPHPEIYLMAANSLGVKADKCLAIEDSDNGVISAFSAGMNVIQVPDLVEPSEKVKAFGHKIFDSLYDVMDYLFLKNSYLTI